MSTEVTIDALRLADRQGQLAAISKSQAVIEFALDGTILSAKFWIQASYNPSLDRDVRPFKVVKFAADSTGQKAAAVEIARVPEDASVVFSAQYTQVQDAVNRSVANLLATVSQIGNASTGISSAAGEISQGNSGLAHRTEEQASSLEEAAANIQQLTTTVKQITDNTREASQLAMSARDQATKAGNVLQSCAVAMDAINGSNRKIADIIGVIDEIAFQTNLLALNAAVEAARAGEQGREFAVVASEVRNLAQRSAGAAKEIKALVNDNVRRVDEGSKLVNSSGITLSEIVGSVKRVADILSEIAAASAEQSSGVDQVNKAIGQMNEVTLKNAALVEEAAAAAESVDEQACGLLESMALFSTGESVLASGRAMSRTSTRPATSAARLSAGAYAQRRPVPSARRPTMNTRRPSMNAQRPSGARSMIGATSPAPAPARKRPSPAPRAAPAQPAGDEWED